jgi:hypothetical protein
MRPYKRIDHDNTASWVMIAVVSIIVGIFMFSAYGCAPAPVVEVEQADHPDFYDRTGNACWREADFIWCEDGYGSWETDQDNLITQSHMHTWTIDSDWQASNGKKVCNWVCTWDSAHTRTTSGYGVCPYP